MLEHLTAFELECKSKNLRPKTLAFYTWQLGQFLSWTKAEGIEQIEDVQKATIQRYLVFQKERGFKDRSVHASFRAIRTFFSFLEADEWIARNPVKKLKAPRVDQVPIKGYSEVEIRTLLAACQHLRDRCILHVLLDTLCRAGELVSQYRRSPYRAASHLHQAHQESQGTPSRLEHQDLQVDAQVLAHARAVCNG